MHDHDDECLVHCCSEQALNGKHSPDWSRAQFAPGTDFVVDVPCKNCRIMGSVKVEPSNIRWF